MGNMQGCCMPQQANVMEVQPPTIEVIARRVACAPFCLVPRTLSVMPHVQEGGGPAPAARGVAALAQRPGHTV